MDDEWELSDFEWRVGFAIFVAAILTLLTGSIIVGIVAFVGILLLTD